MRALITGGAGFIGSHVTDRLLAGGHEVLVIDNFVTGRRDNLDPKTPGLEIIEGDICDIGLVERSFDKFKPEIVLHAAASYKDPEDWETDARTNAVGSAIVVRQSRRLGVGRFVYLQTALCYGLHPSMQPIPRDLPLDPGASSYAISKTAGERYVRLSGLDWISFRLANAYGPRNLSGPLPTFYSRLTARKPCFVMDTRRDFIFVSDLVDVVTAALLGHGTSGTYHVSTGVDVPIQQLFEATVSALGITLDQPVEVRPRGPDDAYTILLDPTVTNEVFGWATSTPLEVGVARAIAYYRMYGLTETYTHLRFDGMQS
jgi:UDP-glucose 4-epimerase